MPTLIPLEHPGVILKEEFIDELDLSVYKVSKGTGINQTALGEITKGKRNISPINALKLAKFFGLSEDYFATLQTHYNLDCAKELETVAFPRLSLFPGKEQMRMLKIC